MKKVLKAIGITLGVVFLLLMLAIAFLSYEFNFKKVNTCSFLVSNDGGGLLPGNAAFQWENDCVKIRVCGEEQEDMLYTLDLYRFASELNFFSYVYCDKRKNS